MTRLFSVLLAATALLATAAPAVAQNPSPYRQVTISATPNPVTFSQPVAFTGDVAGAKDGVLVTLQSAPASTGPWTSRASTRTAKNGKYTVRHRPTVNTYYRVVAGEGTAAAASAPLLVRVAMLVGFKVSDSTPSRGEQVLFSGIVRPRHDGRLAYVQRLSSTGRFVTVSRVRLRALDSQSSRYSVRLRIRRTGTYRVRVLGHTDHAMGISRTRTLTVG